MRHIRNYDREEHSHVLYVMEQYSEAFYPPPGRYEDSVEIFDDATGDWVYLPCSSAFSTMVLALKDKKYNGVISIVHERKDRKNGEYVSYRSYRYNNVTRMVECVENYSSYRINGEREIA